MCFSLHKYFLQKVKIQNQAKPLIIFSAFLKKITTTKSSANFQTQMDRAFIYLFTFSKLLTDYFYLCEHKIYLAIKTQAHITLFDKYFCFGYIIVIIQTKFY